MPNNLEMLKAYLPLVDEVFKAGSTTAGIDTLNGGLIQYVEATHEFKIPAYGTSGLGDYGRNGKGYPEGSVSLSFETKKPNYDRAVTFGVEDRDNTETVGIAFRNLAGSFMRNHVIPETDAFRYSKYSGFGSITKDGALATGDEWLEALRAATVEMDSNEFPTESRFLRILPAVMDAINALETYKSKEVLGRFASVRTVPPRRFVSAITLKSGHDGKTLGWEVATGAKQIGFQVIVPQALIQFRKSLITKVFSPQENQKNDKWLLFYHDYGICEVLDNKKNGIAIRFVGNA